MGGVTAGVGGENEFAGSSAGAAPVRKSEEKDLGASASAVAVADADNGNVNNKMDLETEATNPGFSA